MKTLKTLSILFVAAFMLGACDNDNEQHLLQMDHPKTYGLLYADQTRDSVAFYTFDTWKVAPDDTPWIKVDGETQIDKTYGLLVLYSIPLSLEPNTTGKTRRGYVRVNTYEYEAYASYVQLGFLRITRPMATPTSYISEYSTIPLEANFTLQDSASFTVDSLSFVTYNPWTLRFKGESNPTWITPAQTEGAEGRSQVTLNLVPNTTDTPREATLLLTSGAVTSEITVRQLARKDD